MGQAGPPESVVQQTHRVHAREAVRVASAPPTYAAAKNGKTQHDAPVAAKLAHARGLKCVGILKAVAFLVLVPSWGLILLGIVLAYNLFALIAWCCTCGNMEIWWFPGFAVWCVSLSASAHQLAHEERPVLAPRTPR